MLNLELNYLNNSEKSYFVENDIEI